MIRAEVDEVTRRPRQLREQIVGEEESALGVVAVDEFRRVAIQRPQYGEFPIAAAQDVECCLELAGLAPEGLELCSDKRLPPLPEVTLLLLARSQALALASRRWVENVIEALQSE